MYCESYISKVGTLAFLKILLHFSFFLFTYRRGSTKIGVMALQLAYE
jgi:hypothetical protein